MNFDLSSDEARWGLLAGASATVAGIAMRTLLKQGWRSWYREDPPTNPADPQVDWRDALLWAGATGAAVALARVLARRGAAAGWRKYVGRMPPV